MPSEDKSTASIDWNTFQIHLADYVRAELSGRNVDKDYSEIVFAIETIPACTKAYYREFRQQGKQKSVAELRQLGNGSKIEKTLQQIITEARADTAHAGWREIVVDRGLAWIDQATNTWREVQFALESLDFGAQSRTSSALASGFQTPERTHGDEPPTEAAMQIYLPDQGLEFAATRTLQANGLHRVEVSIAIVERFGDYSGIEIKLRWGDVVHQAITDSLGKVTFEDLPPAPSTPPSISLANQI